MFNRSNHYHDILISKGKSLQYLLSFMYCMYKDYKDNILCDNTEEKRTKMSIRNVREKDREKGRGIESEREWKREA